MLPGLVRAMFSISDCSRASLRVQVGELQIAKWTLKKVYF